VARDAGRDPATLRHSAMVGVLIGRDAAEVERRSRAVLDAFGVADEATAWFETRRPRWIYGTPDEARAMVARFEAAGCERIMLQDFLPWDLEHVDLIGEVLVRG
jgi:alkanesulfonate monooxygenase SsuD/methylene tetrahydromethanopterin reductase-like flavin-dependent oxidoreductase (luciferase family)